jgi:hypothetical protein
MLTQEVEHPIRHGETEMTSPEMAGVRMPLRGPDRSRPNRGNECFFDAGPSPGPHSTQCNYTTVDAQPVITPLLAFPLSSTFLILTAARVYAGC